MKLITNTIEEAKENVEVSIKENFEPETVFDDNFEPKTIMKDLELVSPEKGVNGTDVLGFEKIEVGLNVNVSNQNGVTLSDVGATEKVNAISLPAKVPDDDDEVLDGDFKLVLSEEEEDLLLADKESADSILGQKAVDIAKCVNDSSKIVNQSTLITSGMMIKSSGTNLIDCDLNNQDKSVCIAHTDDAEHIKETLEGSFIEREIEISSSDVVGMSDSKDSVKTYDNEDTSNAENDREAKEKLLFLLKETPPEMEILNEEQIDFEKEEETDTDEVNKLLSLLEDSQSSTSLNLPTDTICSSNLTKSESNSESGNSHKNDNFDKNNTITPNPLDVRLANILPEKEVAKPLAQCSPNKSIVNVKASDIALDKKNNINSDLDVSSSSLESSKFLERESGKNLCNNSSVGETFNNSSFSADSNKSALSNSVDTNCFGNDKKTVATKRRIDFELTNRKRLKRSSSCHPNDKPVFRKRSYSLDNPVSNDKTIVKRLQPCPEVPFSKVEALNNLSCDVGESKEIACSPIDIKSASKDTCEGEGCDKQDIDSSSVDNLKQGSLSLKKDEGNISISCESNKNDVTGNKEQERNSSAKGLDNVTTASKESDANKVVTSNCSAESKRNISKELLFLTKIHKDKFKSLTRWDLEELIVQKICESIADRSEIGELRKRVKTLEQSVESWRKKSLIIEKSNREIKTVLNKYLKEVDDNIADKSKPIIPIRITRSVGLQVAPPPSERFKGINRGPVIKHSDNIKTLKPNPAMPIRENVQACGPKTKFTIAPRPPPQKTSPPKPPVSQIVQRVNTSNSNIIATSPNRTTVVRRSVPVNQNNDVNIGTGTKRIITTVSSNLAGPVNITTSVGSDLEVIDLTDKDERNFARAVVPTSNVRILPRTNNPVLGKSPNGMGQQMTFVLPQSTIGAEKLQAVVRGNQRQQLFLATTSAQIRPATPAAVMTGRPNTSQTLTIPGTVVMKNGTGTFVSIASQPTAGVVVRSSNPSLVSRAGHPLRLSSPVSVAQSPLQVIGHPAPLPPSPVVHTQPGWLMLPPKPVLKVSKTTNGIMLSWSMALNKSHEEIASYQLYAYQESSIPPNSNLWKKVGDVKALPLPMACTLTQFVEGHKYHFAVRAVDVHSRVGSFSSPSTILLE